MARALVSARLSYLVPLGVFPHAKPSEKCVRVAAQTATLREFLRLLGIASPENHVIGPQRLGKVSYNLRDVLPPLLAASLLQASAPNVVLVGPFSVGKMRKFQRSYFAVHDRARSDASAQTQEKHLSFLVGAERLHGRVVDDPDRAPECSFKVKIDPSLCQIVRFRNGPTRMHRSRIAKGHNVVLPVLGKPSHF